MLLNSHILAYARCLAGKVCGLMRSTWGTSQGEDKLGATDKILNTKVVRQACAGHVPGKHSPLSPIGPEPPSMGRDRSTGANGFGALPTEAKGSRKGREWREANGPPASDSKCVSDRAPWGGWADQTFDDRSGSELKATFATVLTSNDRLPVSRRYTEAKYPALHSPGRHTRICDVISNPGLPVHPSLAPLPFVLQCAVYCGLTGGAARSRPSIGRLL